MQPGECPPRAADRVEVAPPALLDPFDFGKLGVDDLPRLLEIASRGIDQAQASERERRGIGQTPTSHVDQLEAAASEIAGKTVGGMEPRHDAKCGELGLLSAREKRDLAVKDAFGLRDEIRPVGGFARGGRGNHLDMSGSELFDERTEAPERAQRTFDGVGGELPSRGDRAPEPAQNLLVEQRRRRPPGILVNDEADRVRPDVNHRNRA